MSKVKLLKIAVCVGAMALLACSAEHGSDSITSLSPGPGGTQAPLFTTAISDNGTLIFGDNIGQAQLVENRMYSLAISPSNNVSANYAVDIVRTSNSASVFNQNLSAGQSVSLSFNQPDDYKMTIVASGAGLSPTTKTYNLVVTCQNNQVTVNSNAISVTSNGSNLFSYSANGVAQNNTDFECAWDFNGDGILDRTYASCATPVDAISNHVGSRRVQVSVRNIACNSQAMASKNVTLTEPSPGANNFIRADISQATNSTSPRTNLTHSSTNNGGLRLVNCNYSGSTWTISGLYNYGSLGSLSVGTSVDHGMRLSIAGAPRGTTTSGPIDTSGAYVSNARFITDQQGDGFSSVLYQGGSTSCSLSNFSLVAAPLAGTPCNGQGTSNPGATVTGQGDFQCSSLSGGGSSVQVQNGQFLCIFHIGDSCIGGGGGGGTPPPQF